MKNTIAKILLYETKKTDSVPIGFTLNELAFLYIPDKNHKLPFGDG